MIRSVVGKVMWVGRATVFLVGLAVVLALMFGVATAALAGNGPGDVFNLGQKNTVNRLSQLVGSTTSAMLRVDNDGTGTALDLRVGSATADPASKTTPPMTVDSQARVANLHAAFADDASTSSYTNNADKLDGKNSTDFAAANHSHPGSEYKNVVIVAKAGGDFATVTAALSSITDASDTNRYLVWVGPGTYNEFVNMKPYVDIQGAGEGVTRIAPSFAGSTAVYGANNAELRYLTMEAKGGPGTCGIAVYNDGASPRLLHVTATVSGGENCNIGVNQRNGASSTLTDVTIDVSGGGTGSYGVSNQSGSSATIRNSDISVSGGGASGSHGVFAHGTDTTITIDNSKVQNGNSTIQAYDGATVRVGASRLAGEAVDDFDTTASVTCAGVYDEDYTFSASTCP